MPGAKKALTLHLETDALPLQDLINKLYALASKKAAGD